LCSEGKNSRRWLFQFCNKLLDRLNQQANLKFTFFLHLDSFKIRKRSTSNEVYAPVFWDAAKELLRKKFMLHQGNEVIYFTQSEGNVSSIENEIQNHLKGFESIPNSRKDYAISEPYSARFFSNHFQSKNFIQIKNIMDVGILTIVPEELAAVTDYFKENHTYHFQRGTQSARRYYLGKVQSELGEVACVAVQATEQGNRSIIAAYNAMVEEFNPSLIVLLGIAGSISKAKLDDVVIADATYYYDKRAVTDTGNYRRLDPYKINSWTKELLNHFLHEYKSDEPKFKAVEGSFQDDFTVFCGPIGTGEAVVKFRDAEEKQWLLKLNDKVLALETEAGGVMAQFYEDELNYSRRANSTLIVRGISDHADQQKDDKWRLPAAKNAMKVLTEFLKINSEEILHPPTIKNIQ
jgi:adenosylhomocysteine nucleosidase